MDQDSMAAAALSPRQESETGRTIGAPEPNVTDILSIEDAAMESDHGTDLPE